MQSNKLKVLFLPSWYPNRNYLSHGIFIKRHALAISRVADVITLYTCSDATIKNGVFEIQENNEGGLNEIIIYYKKVNSSIPVFSSSLKFIRFIRAYFKGYSIVLAKYGKPNIIHLNVIFNAGIFAYLISKLKNIPLVITEQWSGYFPEDGNYKGVFIPFVTRLSVNRARAVIAVSENLRDAMLSHNLKSDYYVIPNVVNTSLFKPSLDKSTVNPIKNILHVSTVNDKEKNISGMLRVVKNISLLRNDFVLNIVGDGPERLLFEKQAEEMGIKNTIVFFKGYKDAKEVAKMMGEADFYVMFSNYETFSTVIVEALAAGTPVVSTAVGVMPSIKDKNVGIMVQPKNELELEAAILKMLDEYCNYNAKDLSKFANNYFSEDKMGEQFLNIYHKVIG